MPLNLSRLRPCDQRWEAMEPTEQGRRCAQCNQQIIDFRGRPDAEIGMIHAASETPVCGVYSAAQLAGTKEADPLPRLRHLVSLVTGLSVASAGAAAAQPLPAPVEQAPAPAGQLPDRGGASPGGTHSTAAPADTLVVRGVVRDSASGQPLRGVAVMLKGTQIGTLTNEQGEYRLRVLPGHVPDSLVLVAMQVGYSRVEQPLPPGESAPWLDVVLPQSELMLISFYVTAVPEKPNVWQRVRRALGRQP